jgi:hypothetical protein
MSRSSRRRRKRSTASAGANWIHLSEGKSNLSASFFPHNVPFQLASRLPSSNDELLRAGRTRERERGSADQFAGFNKLLFKNCRSFGLFRVATRSGRGYQISPRSSSQAVPVLHVQTGKNGAKKKTGDDVWVINCMLMLDLGGEGVMRCVALPFSHDRRRLRGIGRRGSLPRA